MHAEFIFSVGQRRHGYVLSKVKRDNRGVFLIWCCHSPRLVFALPKGRLREHQVQGEIGDSRRVVFFCADNGGR